MDRNRRATDTEGQETKPRDSSANRTKTIRAALTELALYRQAKVTDETLKAYCARLGKENVDDVLGAIRTIQDLPRLEGELSFPEIGVFLAITGALAIARQNRQAVAANKTTLVRWHCPECGIHFSGFTSAEDFRDRRCQGFSKDKEVTFPRKICGALMEEDFREDNFKSGNQARA